MNPQNIIEENKEKYQISLNCILESFGNFWWHKVATRGKKVFFCSSSTILNIIIFAITIL